MSASAAQLRADVLEAHALCHPLQLVTCGGTCDTTTRSYLSNIVAYTTLTSTTTAS